MGGATQSKFSQMSNQLTHKKKAEDLNKSKPTEDVKTDEATKVKFVQLISSLLARNLRIWRIIYQMYKSHKSKKELQILKGIFTRTHYFVRVLDGSTQNTE